MNAITLESETGDSLSPIIGKIVTDLFSIVVIFIVGLGVAAYGAFVLTTIWDWFLVPAGYAALSFKTAIGAALIVSLLTAKDAKVAGAMREMPENKPDPAIFSDAAKRFTIVCVFMTMVLASAFAWTLILPN